MRHDYFNLEGKKAVITGASRGIGAAIAESYAIYGAEVALVSRKLKGLQNVEARITESGGKAIPFQADIKDISELPKLVENIVAEFGQIDILVNNAGGNPAIGPVLDTGEKVWDTLLDLNLKGPFFLSQCVGKQMMGSGGGSIINISSNRGIRPGVTGIGPYAISKAAILMLTKVLASEWGRFNIRVNCIAPGLIKTKFSKALWSDPGYLEDTISHQPINRIGTPEDIIGAAIYLASEASSYMTGETILIDGGRLI
jgi:NAD(P)-dependent dehydrogenase (short-subunit alcohol dehydrogenase family)